jgi:hypothetical protein
MYYTSYVDLVFFKSGIEPCGILSGSGLRGYIWSRILCFPPVNYNRFKIPSTKIVVANDEYSTYGGKKGRHVVFYISYIKEEELDEQLKILSQYIPVVESWTITL